MRRSSGDRALDQAALKILRLASPFEPLPAKIRSEVRSSAFRLRVGFLRDARNGATQAQTEGGG